MFCAVIGESQDGEHHLMLKFSCCGHIRSCKERCVWKKNISIGSTVADPGFPRGRTPTLDPPPGGNILTYYLTNFPRKLHKNEEILAHRGGGHASLALPRSADGPTYLFTLQRHYL